MVITFNVTDSENKVGLDGVIRMTVYNTTFDVPLVNGVALLDVTGSYKGLTRSFVVIVHGYVNHKDFFIQHDGVVLNISLVRFLGVPAPTPPIVVVEEQPSTLLPLIKGAAIVLAGKALLS